LPFSDPLADGPPYRQALQKHFIMA